MFQNYLKSTLRNLNKNRLYTFINSLGLTVGMTCFILIAFYLQYELSYDQQHEKVDQIYRIAQQQKGNAFRGSDQFATTPLVL
ncbi:MAG: ABC transporter permease, partial [Bacteroidota bacterium]